MHTSNLSPFGESDYLLRQRVMRCLQQRHYASHRALQIDVKGGVVVVQGRLPSYYLRQVAIECIKHVPGVLRLEDRIRVADGFQACSFPEWASVSDVSPSNRRSVREKQRC